MKNMEKEQAVAIIKKNFPQLSVDSIEIAGEGMDSKAFEVNEELIFRFPKYADVGEKLKVEISLLPQLRSYFKLLIPNFEYIGEQTNGLPFVGYKKIQGVPLERELFDSLDQELQEKLIMQIADFIKQIHSFPVEEAKKLGAKIVNFQENYTSDFAELKNKAWHLLDNTTQIYIEELFKTYLSDKENFNYLTTLLHSDLSPEHIIYDQDEKSIVGIIDFGDMEIGDPDYDLMYLYREYSLEFVQKLLKYYPHKNQGQIISKLYFLSRCNTIHDILIAVDRKDDDKLKRALDKLKTRM